MNRICTFLLTVMWVQLCLCSLCKCLYSFVVPHMILQRLESGAQTEKIVERVSTDCGCIFRLLQQKRIL